MEDTRYLLFNCFKCKIAKHREYSGLNSKGNPINVDEKGLRWSGYTCGECHREACKQKARLKSQVKVVPNITCSTCKNTFKPKSNKHLHCSPTCKFKANWVAKKKSRPANRCLYCTAPMDLHNRKYCSSRCQYKANYKPSNKVPIPILTRSCRQCCIEFKTKREAQHFCARPCKQAFAATNKKPTVKKYISRKKLILPRTCTICMLTYTPKMLKQKYCSDKCANKASRKQSKKQRKAYDKARELKKKQRVPAWANLKAISDIYISCPEGYHVDHIIPLNGVDVCGLHVEYNLQHLSEEDNIKKSNSFDGTYDNLSWKNSKDS